MTPPEIAALATVPAAPSLPLRIHARLREAIIRGEYPQGQKLPEVRIADELAVSRVPLREAVPMLESEGFVVTTPRRGAVVATWTSRLVHDLFDLREVLEVGAARHAARAVAGGASVDALHEALEHSHAVVDDGDPYAIAAASTRFHEVIVEMTGNTLMQASMRSVSGRVQWLFYLTSELDVHDAFHDHVELAAAIERGDERMAEALAYSHIERDRMPSIAALHPRD
ncbi:GntR family transcriptional regulator [Curtobacterium sp. MCBD17_013]|uniref:GntR family transcriptional regulator n=1 Tax=Curtobacterium sp. MCBD17_013 TaxID=2175668 RepID=UPI000DA6E736|nr:GntR family transcriptional regulator [Curtobacterium sp. MCBD17_013]PZF65052.1 GntR family transcriptional regulator [Curtobacterium sp. MCBD17_013]